MSNALKNHSSSQQLSKQGDNFLVFLERFYEKHQLGEILNLQKIILACERMEQCHEGQKRKNGKPYYIHPYNVAKIYCLSHKKNISTRGIIAALIHDNIENAIKSGVEENYDSIKERFGKEDAIICETLSKKTKNHKDRNEEYFNRFESLKTLRDYINKLSEEKGLNLPNEDIRAIAFKTALIKICDRIHNLRTMEDFSILKITDKLEETKNYMQSLAEELGQTHPKILEFFTEAIIAAETQIIRKKVEETN